VYVGTGAGMFGLAGSFVAGSATFGVALGDLNGDGKPDLVAANQASNNVSVLLATGPSGFSPSVNYATGLNCVSVAIGDLNSDGIPDLVAADVDISGISVLLGNGNGHVPAQVELSRRGQRDRLCHHRRSERRRQARSGGVELFHPTTSRCCWALGTARFRRRCSLARRPAPTGVGIGDFNGDGRPDLAVSNFDGNNVSVLLQRVDVPTITLNPVPQSALTGNPASFTVSATSLGGAPTYQWRRNGVNLANGGAVSGALGRH